MFFIISLGDAAGVFICIGASIRNGQEIGVTGMRDSFAINVDDATNATIKRGHITRRLVLSHR